MILKLRRSPSIAELGIVRKGLYIGGIMKTLVIHPKDKTTDFLTPIYDHLSNTTVVKGGVRKSEVQGLIESHDRVIMLGHGAPFGLMNPKQFPDAGFFIVDETMVSRLKEKSSIYVWCHADQFLAQNRLSGLCSGMFISEPGEADFYRYEEIDSRLIDQSNEKFASILSKYISEPLDILYQSLLIEYEVVARTNPIALFNFKRLYLYSDGVNMKLVKEIV